MSDYLVFLYKVVLRDRLKLKSETALYFLKHPEMVGLTYIGDLIERTIDWGK